MFIVDLLGEHDEVGYKCSDYRISTWAVEWWDENKWKWRESQV